MLQITKLGKNRIKKKLSIYLHFGTYTYQTTQQRATTSKKDDQLSRDGINSLVSQVSKSLKEKNTLPIDDILTTVKTFSLIKDIRTEARRQKEITKKTNLGQGKTQGRDVFITLDTVNTKQKSITLDESQPTHHPPQLAYGLERTLFQPMTLHLLRDPRSKVYNFEEEVETIQPDMLKRRTLEQDSLFITPHRDQALLTMATKFNKKYMSSTSSMTSVLSHLHFLLSNFRKLNIVDSSISKHFPQKDCNFTRGAQFPASIILRKMSDTVYSIDSDRSLDREIILSILGHSLEEFLTLQKDKDLPESYHYSKIDDFILRSQLDAYNDKLPGTGVFDLKTRAVTAIRHDLSYVENNNNFTGYDINKIYGVYESLEREFFELIRSTLLKYSLQARIGKMDGIFVAYHNISKIFGFQYLPLEEMDYLIHSSCTGNFRNKIKSREKVMKGIYGHSEFIVKHQRQDREIATEVAEKEFKMSIVLFKNILNHIQKTLKKRNLNWQKCKIMLKTESKRKRIYNNLELNVPILTVVALPLSDDYVDIPLSTKSSEESLEQISKIREKNLKLLEEKSQSLIGFEAQVSHLIQHHPLTLTIPSFAKVGNKILSAESCNFISKKINKDYYGNLPSWKTPNFFHPLDVSTWKCNINISDITNSEKLKQFYISCLNEKLSSLEQQSNLDDTMLVDQSTEVSERIEKFMNKGKNIEKVNDDHCANDRSKKASKVSGKNRLPSHYQKILRAYGLKGSERTKINTGS
ncbi:Pet127p NDAI_0A08420 [Naumovozyma dairenensis CBS 421]|uniref:Pet127p n=1 Tax=Naumovozyma dairenensis (strain ATCC 10597 / BCRC 20456 / CBS 421 / NBRC 0211 / NRRL Y-12639) TaxID=1071378 RepID=G0W5A7_NAUDC|nr:hypothetical protein NDAI_0A08420 [Naumovozyma dairenensis CBS 421]CCD22995.1 hypothetical protein NDAI_0A08420 [Naumovozyma dairenensis CBS 421]